MWVSYPPEAAEENWLHDSLVTMIRTIHNELNLGHGVPNWDILIAAILDPDKAAIIKPLTGIKENISIYGDSVRDLTSVERDTILQTLTAQNDIEGLISGVSVLASIKTTFPEVNKAVHKLFVFAYEKLTDLGVRDRQYRIIYERLETKVCPFCGFERIMSPQETRQDQDHYLAKNIYPFAAANMRNLVPMCRCCNRDYKHDVDTLCNATGERRRAYDPYNAPGIDISLVRSMPFEGLNNRLPAWWIDITPDCQESETWDQIFCIKMRYGRDVLNNGFNRWIDSFKKQCAKKKFPTNLSNIEVLSVLKEHHENTLVENPVGLDFLKPKVFEMLVHHFESGNARIISFVRDAVIGIRLQM